MKPNLFIVGAPKCGTTAWVSYLSSHPDIFFPEIKEPHYFNTDAPTERRMALDDYRRLYANTGGKPVVGDGSTGYLRSETAAKAIHDFNPDAKILIFLRNQQDCLRSWHNQLLFNGTEIIEDFETAWRLSGKRDKSNMSEYCLNPRTVDYKRAGLFADCIHRYLDLFGPDQVRVLYFDDWIADPRPAYAGVLGFLGVEDDRRTEFPAANEARHQRTRLFVHLVRRPPRFLQSAVKAVKRLLGRESLGLGKLSPRLREEIREFFREDNERVLPLIWRPQAPQ